MSGVVVHIRVQGKVEGVGFRDYTRRQARALGLGGFVRNLVDGSVEAQAIGDRDALESFVAAIERGPSSGRVDQCLVDWHQATMSYGEFEVRTFQGMS